MRVSIDELKKILNNDADGNYNKFARLTKIDVGLLYRIINLKSNAGLKTISQIIAYCKATNKDYNKIIFLD